MPSGTGGADTTARNAANAAQQTADNALTTANNANTTANTARTEIVELKNRFENAAPRTTPDYWLRGTDARTYLLHVDPDITLGHDQILVSIQGVALPRQSIVAGQSTYTLSVDATASGNIDRAVGNANLDSITVGIQIYDGSTVEDERQIKCMYSVLQQ